MTTGLAGAVRLRSGRRGVSLHLAAGCASAACFLLAPVAAAGFGAPAPVVLAANTVPIPHLSPTNDPPDAVGPVITDDDREATAAEDSDVPEVGDVTDTPEAPAPIARPDPGVVLDSAGLKLALEALSNGDPAGATIAAYALPNPIDIKIVDWLVATSGDKQVSSDRIADVRKKLPDWPGQGLLRLRYEQAIVRENPSAADVVRALGGTEPMTDEATILLGQSYLATGHDDEAAKLIRAFWRTQDLSESQEKTILSDFSGQLTAADHKARMDRLLYDESSDAALRTAQLLDADQQALAKAVVAVISDSSDALKTLDALPSSVKNDPLAVYSRIQALRRANKIDDAAALLVAAPRDPAVIVDPDAWWIERRLISRALIDLDEPKLAYQIAADHSAETPTLRAEAEFHAGWYALEFLHEPDVAAKHFAAIAAISTRPLSLSRAEYWLGRAASAAGNAESATAHFRRAAAYPTAFYGQLASARLGEAQLQLTKPPPATDATRERFESRDLVRVIRHLSAAGATDQVGLFYRSLAETLSDPSEIGLLAAMAEQNDEHQIALQIGVIAGSRGLPVDALAFPTAAIPASAKTPDVDRPVVFAVARQESNFNPEAVSSAGARGLLQLMPATAREAAKIAGVKYSQARLTSDPGYNATLGAVHLGGLIDNFGGSYVMSFAAYNAGARRVADWVKQYGDPRDPKVDVVDWIERIPFTETRNYVQRIMENLQVYRARLESPTLMIESDLKRGAPD